MPKKKQQEYMCQDWDPVVWKKSKPKTSAEDKKRGLKVETVKRFGVKTNQNNSHTFLLFQN